MGCGIDDAEEVKKHVFFESINFQDLYDKKVLHLLSSELVISPFHAQIKAPVKPKIKDDNDSEALGLTPLEDSKYICSYITNVHREKGDCTSWEVHLT